MTSHFDVHPGRAEAESCLRAATPGELADALGEADTALERASQAMDAITRELRRRGCHRASGQRYAVVFGDLDEPFLLDMTAIADAVAGVDPEGGPSCAA